jgi:glycosyltransferase involved in cell wall biosynthesis
MATPSDPLTISVVTVVLNDRRHIRSTVDSVIAQDYRPMEYIVVDGGSRDGTRAILAGYSKRIDRVIAGRDRNLYDAMNKGAGAATGDYVVFMNSGDRFHNPRTVSEVVACIDPSRLPDLVYGAHVRDTGRLRIPVAPGDLNQLWKRMAFSHQSLFSRTRLLQRFPYDVSEDLVADFKSVLAFKMAGAVFQAVPVVVAVCPTGGLSDRRRLRGLLRRWRIVRRLLPSPWVTPFYMWLITCSLLSLAAKRLLPPNAVDWIAWRRRRS